MRNLVPTYAIQATSATNSLRDIVGFAVTATTINKVIEAVSDSSLYEAHEERPCAAAILRAANVLVNVKPVDWSTVEIEPYMGEISLNWRNGRDRRVKAIIPKNGSYFSTYHEDMQNGRVASHSLKQRVNHEYLTERLNWLRAAR
jgi:hypothetical protein